MIPRGLVRSLLFLALVFLAVALGVASSPVEAREARVVVTINPLHSLVALVMEGTPPPQLLLRGNVTPHSGQLRPSQVRLLQRAEVVVYVDERLEVFLQRWLPTLPSTTRQVQASTLGGIRRCPAQGEHRHGEDDHAGEHAGHDEDDHAQEHAGHDEGDHAEEHAGASSSKAVHSEGAAEQACQRVPLAGLKKGEKPPVSNLDAHIWLDTENAATILRQIAVLLGEVYPQHAELYRANARRGQVQLGQLDVEIRQRLNVDLRKPQPYVVYHDAYQYFERRFDLLGLGTLLGVEGERLSVAHLRRLRGVLSRWPRGFCAFYEPQLPRQKIDALLRDFPQASVLQLDPLGAAHAPGSQAYFGLLRDIAGTFQRCLASLQPSVSLSLEEDAQETH